MFENLNNVKDVTFLCPVFVTGGTEAIHQAAAAMNRHGLRARIAYTGEGIVYERDGQVIRRRDGANANACEIAFAALNPVAVREIRLSPDHLIVVPEIHALQRQQFAPARFAIWWLSVDNAFNHSPALSDPAVRFDLFGQRDIIHLYQSEYARRFLIENSAVATARLMDVTDPAFLAPAGGARGASVLFNRKKGLDLARTFFDSNLDLKPLALDGLTRPDLARVYAENSIYVDFGTLPGKDRMPREAALGGCVVFVHDCGAGREMGDFPLRNHYRFTADDVASGDLARRVKETLSRLDIHRDDQRHFRRSILAEGADFEEDIGRLAAELTKTSSNRGLFTDDLIPTSRPPLAGKRVVPSPVPERQTGRLFGESREALRDGASQDRCIWIVSPPGYDHHRAFDEIALALSGAFAERGASAPVVHHPSEWGGRLPIVLGAHLLSPNMALILPPGSIIYNLEQVSRESHWINASYVDLMRRHRVFDYSHRNLAALRAAGVAEAGLLAPGYSAVLTRIVPSPVQNIDVLFYGSLNERRAAVLEALRAQGLVVVHLFGVYGAERDAAIARSKLVLNLHFYEAGVFESPRVTYLLSNGACVVTEGELNDPDISPYRGGLGVCAYPEIVPLCMALLADEPLRRALAAQGLALVKQRRLADGLDALLVAARSATPAAA